VRSGAHEEIGDDGDGWTEHAELSNESGFTVAAARFGKNSVLKSDGCAPRRPMRAARWQLQPALEKSCLGST
jgi:hypothetical protein